MTTIGAAASGARKHAGVVGAAGGGGPQGSLASQSHHGSGSLVAPEDVPIRLAVTFAPNRARLTGFPQSNLFGRYQRRMSDALFVVANHGVLLEYTLDPIPDSSKQNVLFHSLWWRLFGTAHRREKRPSSQYVQLAARWRYEL